MSASAAVFEYCCMKKMPIGSSIIPIKLITIVTSYALHSVWNKKLEPCVNGTTPTGNRKKTYMDM